MPSLLEPSRPPGIAALGAWFWSLLSAGSGVFYGSCRCVDPATGRARSKRQSVAPDGATGLFLAGGRRPPVRAQACGVMVEAGRSHASQTCPGWVATSEKGQFRTALRTCLPSAGLARERLQSLSMLGFEA